MMRSLFSGVAGLKVHQTKMDVIGNNIANVNTVGFKSSSTVFSDVFYQTTQASSGPNKETNVGGINSKQIGLGANVAAISKNISGAGGSQTTNNAFDCMLSGDSFFITKNGGRTYFTKNGAFTVDADGTLTTSDGAKVQGWQVDPDDPTKTKPGPVSNLNIMSPENMYTDPEATKASYISGNIDKTDTQMASGSAGRTFQMNFYDKLGYKYTAKFVIKQSSVSDNAYNIELKDILRDGKSIMYTEKKNDDGSTEYTPTGWGAKLSKEKLNPTDVGQVDSVENGQPNFGDESKFNMVFDGTTGKFKTLVEEGGSDYDASNAGDEAPIKKWYLNIGGKTPNPFENIEMD
ncbi:MAG: flagellar hook-basal body complex protein, partial [Catonella sp.]|uniref:flagellar hook-basal body complex protein n=1 Tax=Catonella sp. TaxID=2382125 RepID=UPI003FA05126